MLRPLLLAAAGVGIGAAQPQPLPASACVPPHHNLSFCNRSLPVATRAALLAEMMTVEELVSQMTDDMVPIPRLGVRQAYIYGVEALHGVASGCPFPGAPSEGGRCFTGFPTASASVTSFNRSLWYAVGRAQGDEARWAYDHGFLSGLHLRGPQLNPQRDPRWGRNDNSPGECAYLEGEFGAQMVLGGQGAMPNGSYPFGEYRKAIHEMKHFVAYSMEQGRNERSDTADISLRDLAEYYFVPLRACIEQADLGAFMCSYSAVNGTASCGNHWMNVEVVRRHWGWDGVIESDCGAVEGISAHRHGGWASASAEAAVAALNASVSVDCMSPPAKNAYTHRLGQAVTDGVVSRAQLEQAVARVYKGRFQTGEFDPGNGRWNLPDDTIYSAAHQQLSLEAAQQSIVLVRNSPTSGAAKLPLKPGSRIAVIGPNGNSSHVFIGSYHGANCAADATAGGLNSTQVRDTSCLSSTFQEIAKVNGAAKTTFVSGCAGPPWGTVPVTMRNKDHMPGPQRCISLVDMDQVNATVKSADVVVLVLGLALQITSAEETDRDHSEAGYTLPGQQLQLARMVAELGKPVVAVVLSGMAVGMDFIAQQEHWPLLVPGYGGRFGPVAIAQALFGHVSPSGRLPYTVYREEWAATARMEDLSLTAGEGRTYKWLGYRNASVAPAFRFGAGLSYSSFDVDVKPLPASALAARSVDSGRSRGALLASFEITTHNVGAVAASDATLVFAAPTSSISEAAPLPRPRKQLVDFIRTPVLKPGATHTATVHIFAEAVAMTDHLGRSVAHRGTYEVIFDGGENASSVQHVVIAKDMLLDTLPPPPLKSDEIVPRESGSCDVTRRGARGEGDDTAAVQRVLDDPNCEEVLLPAGSVVAASVLFVRRSDVTLTVADGAVLRGLPATFRQLRPDCSGKGPSSLDCDGCEFNWRDWCAMIRVESDSNFTLRGAGTIEPGGTGDSDPDFYSALHVRSTVGVQLGAGLRVHCTAWWWCTALHNATDVHVSRLFVDGRTGRDGMDLVNCRRVLIEDSRIEGSDDALCFKTIIDNRGGKSLAGWAAEDVVVRRTTLLSTWCNAVQFGSATELDMRNFSFRDIVITGARKSAIGIVSMDSANISALRFHNVSIRGQDVATPLYVKVGNRINGEDNLGHWPPGSISDVNLSEVRAVDWGHVSKPKPGHSASYTATIEGLDAEHRVGPVRLEGVAIQAPGGGDASAASRDPPISALDYQPRYNGVRPSWGLFVRHARGISMRSTAFTAVEPDGRHALVADDVVGLELQGTSVATKAPCQLALRNVSGDWQASGLRTCEWTPSDK
jgi:beta-D-xylosidase 4